LTINPFHKGLYWVLDTQNIKHHPWQDAVHQAMLGGVSCVQLRQKHTPLSELFPLAQTLKTILDQYHKPFIINDDALLAKKIGASGVHLGQTDMSVMEARALLGKTAIIGLSVETEAQFLQAQALPLDYIALSPVFLTPTKSELSTAWGLQGLAWAKKNTQKPLVAIGGINTENYTEVFKAGADCIAVVSALSDSKNIQQTAKMLSTYV
jgi:thiamine-phosphate pyrophosphorylase